MNNVNEDKSLNIVMTEPQIWGRRVMFAVLSLVVAIPLDNMHRLMTEGLPIGLERGEINYAYVIGMFFFGLVDPGLVFRLYRPVPGAGHAGRCLFADHLGDHGGAHDTDVHGHGSTPLVALCHRPGVGLWPGRLGLAGFHQYQGVSALPATGSSHIHVADGCHRVSAPQSGALPPSGLMAATHFNIDPRHPRPHNPQLIPFHVEMTAWWRYHAPQ
jgi:hypothetical protein